jgi:hypothetical protein
MLVEVLPGVCQGRAGVEFRNKTKSVAKVAKVLGASKHKLHADRGYSEEVSCDTVGLHFVNLRFKYIELC